MFIKSSKCSFTFTGTPYLNKDEIISHRFPVYSMPSITECIFYVSYLSSFLILPCSGSYQDVPKSLLNDHLLREVESWIRRLFPQWLCLALRMNLSATYLSCNTRKPSEGPRIVAPTSAMTASLLSAVYWFELWCYRGWLSRSVSIIPKIAVPERTAARPAESHHETDCTDNKGYHFSIRLFRKV